MLTSGVTKAGINMVAFPVSAYGFLLVLGEVSQRDYDTVRSCFSVYSTVSFRCSDESYTMGLPSISACDSSAIELAYVRGDEILSVRWWGTSVHGLD